MSRKTPKKEKPVRKGKGARKPVLLDSAQLKAAKLLGIAGYEKGARRRTRIVEAVALECGVSHDTLYRWADKPEFAAEMERQRIMRLKKADEALDELLEGKLIETKEGQVWIPPNVTAVIFTKKTLDWRRSDDQLRRERLRFKYELKLLEAKQRKLKETISELPPTVYQSLTIADVRALRDELDA